MAGIPSYITDEHVFYSDVTTPAALLRDGATQWLLPYEFLVDQRSQTDLDLLVEANGGTLPLANVDVAMNLILDNGLSWYETYLGVTKFITTATLPTYAQFHGGGGGGGGDYVLPVASASTLGGVKIPAQGGLTVGSDGTLSVDLTKLAPAGDDGQVLTSQGTTAPPDWEGLDGGGY